MFLSGGYFLLGVPASAARPSLAAAVIFSTDSFSITNSNFSKKITQFSQFSVTFPYDVVFSWPLSPFKLFECWLGHGCLFKKKINIMFCLPLWEHLLNLNVGPAHILCHCLNSLFASLLLGCFHFFINKSSQNLIFKTLQQKFFSWHYPFKSIEQFLS